MHPRWHTDQPVAPLVPHSTGDRVEGVPAEDYFNGPLPDLERQLAAELSGAAWAVVAFAPEDAVWSDWIYRNINGYPLPASLVDRVTPHGFPRPDCLSVFPDRRDPQFAEHYPEALKEGVYLVVVCSPHSAQCTELEEKIRVFKGAGGEERIVVLVVDGPPEEKLGEQQRTLECDWLPSWLRWRLEQDGFRTAERSEPRVVDARRGYRSVKQVRDGILTALVDMDAAEFERLGGCARPVDSVLLSEPAPAGPAIEMTTAVAAQTRIPVSRRGGSKYTICLAVVLILVAVVFGVRSFWEITADEPVSTLEVRPVTGALPGHSEKSRTADDASTSQAPQLPAEVAPAVDGAPTVAKTAEPAAPVPVDPEDQVNPPAQGGTTPSAAPTQATALSNVPVPVAKTNVAQMAPAPVYPSSRIVPHSGGVYEWATPAISVITPATPATPVTPVATPSSTETDAVLQDEVRTLDRRGNEKMAERQTDDALDLYKTALDSAVEFAGRKTAGPNAVDQAVALACKTGILEVKLASTAEGRAYFLKARNMLLQEKAHGHWSRERAKSLDLIEWRLLTVPRD